MLFDFSPILTYTHSVCKKEFDIQRKSFWLTLFIAEAFDAPKGFSAEHEINRDIEGGSAEHEINRDIEGVFPHGMKLIHDSIACCMDKTPNPTEWIKR